MSNKNQNDKFFVFFSTLTSLVIVLGVLYFSDKSEHSDFFDKESPKQFSDESLRRTREKLQKFSNDSNKPNEPSKKASPQAKRQPAQRKSYNKSEAYLLKQKIIAKERTVNPDGLKFESLQPRATVEFENTNGMSYKKLAGFYAVKKTADNEDSYAGADYKLGYFIVASETPITGASVVVENSDTGALGIFTGIIKVKLKDLNEARQILSHQDYEVSKIYDHISVVFYQFDDFDITLNSLAEFREHPGVKRANIEVLEYVRREK